MIKRGIFEFLSAIRVRFNIVEMKGLGGVMDFTGLMNVLEEFDSHSWKGDFLSGDWEIANGGYDLWFEISYLDEVLVRCVDGELSFKNRLNGSVMKELSDVITGVYDHLRVDLADRRKMLEGSFEVGQEFFEKTTGRYFTLSGEGGRSFNIWNIDVFDSNKEFLHRTSVHAGRLANDILDGVIVPAGEVQKGLDELIRDSEGKCEAARGNRGKEVVQDFER